MNALARVGLKGPSSTARASSGGRLRTTECEVKTAFISAYAFHPACGLAGGMDLPTTVAPFILRGVSLIGIDSVMCPLPPREAAWRRLEADLDREKIAAMANEIGLDDVIAAGRRIVEGKVRGRIVVKIR